MAVGRDEPELAGEQSLAWLTEANRCQTHCNIWPSGKSFRSVTPTFWTGLTAHYIWAYALDQAKCCNQLSCNGCLSTQEGNICVRRFPICSTSYGKTFVIIVSPNFVPNHWLSHRRVLCHGAWEAEHMVKTAEVRTRIVFTFDVVIACVSITMKRGCWKIMQSFSL